MNKFQCLSLSLNLSLNMNQNHPYLDVRGLEGGKAGCVWRTGLQWPLTSSQPCPTGEGCLLSSG